MTEVTKVLYPTPGIPGSNVPAGEFVMDNEKGLVQIERPRGIVAPIVSADEALNAWKAYEHLKMKIATPSDVQKIQGKDFKKKSFWRKMSKFFGLSLSLVSEKQENETWYVMYRATARTGDYMDGDGACSMVEKNKHHSLHDARAIAHTRAKNRAISDLVGGGEVSAEEISGDVYSKAPSYSQSKPFAPSTKQLNDLYDLAAQQKWTPEQVKLYMETAWKIGSSQKLTINQYNTLYNIIKENKPEKALNDAFL